MQANTSGKKLRGEVRMAEELKKKAKKLVRKAERDLREAADCLETVAAYFELPENIRKSIYGYSDAVLEAAEKLARSRITRKTLEENMKRVGGLVYTLIWFDDAFRKLVRCHAEWKDAAGEVRKAKRRIDRAHRSLEAALSLLTFYSQPLDAK